MRWIIVALLLSGCTAIAPVESAHQVNATVGKTYEFESISVTVDSVQINPDGMAIAMQVENTSGDEVDFYPNLGSVVIGTQQLDARDVERSLSGTYQPGVIKAGTMLYQGSLIPEDVTEFTIDLGKATNYETYESEDDLAIILTKQ